MRIHDRSNIWSERTSTEVSKGFGFAFALEQEIEVRKVFDIANTADMNEEVKEIMER